MGRIRKISILASFFSLWLHSIIPQSWELILSFFLIFSFGIIHGANDITLLNASSIKKQSKPYQILLVYIMIVLIGVFLFFLIPSVALLLFILVSSYHFGEQHFNYFNSSESKTIILFRISYGMTILSLIFINHKAEVSSIIENLTTHTTNPTMYNLVFGISLVSLILSTLLIIRKESSLRKVVIEELFNLLVLALIFKVSPLIFGFSVYFIFWHSIPSIHDQINFIYGKNSMQNTLAYFKKGALFWIISLIGIGILSYLLIDTYLFEALLFSFIAAITFPHVWVMINLFKTKKANP